MNELLSCDWVSLLIATARNCAREAYVFAVPMSVIGGQELLNLLDAANIEHWGHLIIHESWVVSVPKESEGKVVRLLRAKGIELT